MKKVIVGSKNPVKVQAALLGFKKMFPEEEFVVEGVSVESGVPHQPLGDVHTAYGACNRMSNAARIRPDADFWVGIEGGVEFVQLDTMAFAWIYISARDGGFGTAKSGTFLLPPKIADLVNQGKGLGGATDIFFNRQNSKQEEGIIGILTDGAINRENEYTEGVVLALIPFKHPELY